MYTIYYTDASLFITMKKTYKTLKEAKDWLIGFAEVKRFSFDNELNIDIPNPDSDEKPHRMLGRHVHQAQNGTGAGPVAAVFVLDDVAVGFFAHQPEKIKDDGLGVKRDVRSGVRIHRLPFFLLRAFRRLR